MAVPFSAGLELLQKSLSVDGAVTSKAISDICAEASCEDLIQHGLDGKIFGCTIDPGTAVFIPAGWLMYETPVNNQPCGGYRLTNVDGTISAEFSGLLNVIMPDEWSTLKPQHSTAFLAKILQATYSAKGLEEKKPLQLLIPKMEQGILQKVKQELKKH